MPQLLYQNKLPHFQKVSILKDCLQKSLITAWNEKSAIIKWEGEYCGRFDFKSRAQEALKVENVLASGTGVETNERRVGNVEQESGEVVILSVTRGVAGVDKLERKLNEKMVEEMVKSESVHIAKGKNESENVMMMWRKRWKLIQAGS